MDCSEKLAASAFEQTEPAGFALTSAEENRVELIVIEDDQIEAEAISRRLQQNHVDVQTHYATDGGVALGHLLRLAKQKRCDRAILVLDLGMPLIGGIELLQQIRSAPDLMQATVFVQTGSADPRLKEVAEQTGVEGYFSKDELPALIAAVKEHVKENAL